MKIVFVHGRAQAGKSKNLKSEWDSILAKGLKAEHLSWPEGVSSVAPFYGDVLEKRTKQADTGDIFGLVRKGPTPSEDLAKRKFYRAVLGEIAERQGIKEESLKDDEGPVQKGVANWRLVNALLRRLNEIKPIANLSIEEFTHDVFYYLQFGYIRGFVDAIVEKEIPHKEPCVVVSHSLGTIVTYNVFASRSDLGNVRAWITLGSPLGIKAIYERLPSAAGKKRIAPQGVPSWLNARDPLDVVALNPISTGVFGGAPAVENDNTIHNQADNRHGISGYLDKAVVVRRIHAACSPP